MIVAETDWDDVIRLREISHSRTVWYSIFLRYTETILPKPFFLPKPLKECSAQDIEDELTRWVGRSKTVGSIQHEESLVSPNVAASQAVVNGDAVALVPGARWMVAGFFDGSIRYFDFEDAQSGDISPHPLISTPFSEREASSNEMEMRLSIDFTSEIAFSTAPGEHYLTQFNLGVVYSNGSLVDDSLVRVWRVRVKFEGGIDGLGRHGGGRALGLEAVECLSAFAERPVWNIYHCHLWGSMIAYSTKLHGGDSDDYIMLVNWLQANGRAKYEGIERWYHGPGPRTIAMHFLPEGQIMVVTQRSQCQVNIFNWQSDWPHSTSKIEARANQGKPIWLREFRGALIRSIVCSAPTFIGDSIRLVIPTPAEIFGVTVPIRRSGHPKDIHVESLAKGFGRIIFNSNHLYGFGCRRGAFIDSSTLCYHAMEYFWSDDKIISRQPRCATIPYPGIDDIEGQLLFDHCSNRIVVAELEFERFIFI
ncbi:hypothetical protein MD484_g5794, partial [Candolleomyces efflorescens]